MSDVLCSECGQPLTSENICICPSCGKMLCTGCAMLSDGMCDDCHFHLSFLY